MNMTLRVFRLELEAVHIVSERLPLISNDPKNANPLDSLSQAALDNAERLLREAIAHSPRYASAHNNLAQVLRMKHDADGTFMAPIRNGIAFVMFILYSYSFLHYSFQLSLPEVATLQTKIGVSVYTCCIEQNTVFHILN